MGLREQTLILVTEDRIMSKYPIKRLNGTSLVYYATSSVAWDALEKTFEAVLARIKNRTHSGC